MPATAEQPRRVAIALGSNLGDRHSHLRHGIGCLAEFLGASHREVADPDDVRRAERSDRLEVIAGDVARSDQCHTTAFGCNRLRCSSLPSFAEGPAE